MDSIQNEYAHTIASSCEARSSVIDELAQASAELEHFVDVLFDRLMPVVRFASQPAQSTTSDNPAAATPVRAVLHHLNLQRSRIQELLDRLEV